MFKKFMSMTLVLVMALSIVGCVSTDPNVTELTENTEVTNPGGDNGGVDPGTTEPEASIPDVSIPDVSEPLPSEPDVSEPADPVNPTDPSEPSEPVDPVDPSEPDVPAHQHSYSEEVTEATCTKDGYTTYSCACGDSYVDGKIEATGHSWSEWVTIEEPTVTATGMAGRNCTACGEAETKVLDKVIPDHTHSYTGKVTTAATCTKEGVKTYTCSCGSSYTESIAKASHSYKATVTAPTCTAKGYTTHKCSACNNSYKDTYVAATGHSYGSYKSNGDATCTKDGTKTAKCTACSVTNTVTDTGSATGHSYKDTVTAPTCTAQGYTTHKCSTCGDSYKDSYTATIAHSYVLTKTKEAPTPWSQGYHQYDCNYCGDSYKTYFAMTEEDCQVWYREIAAAAVKYINQLRVEQGDTEAISLPGLTLVAEYRAVQLQDNFAHSTADLREAYAYYQYGEWHDNTAYGGTQYWSANAKEAIAKGGDGTSTDEYGRSFAEQIMGSPNHWAYVGSSEFTYIGIGITYGRNGLCMCILQTKENYG